MKFPFGEFNFILAMDWLMEHRVGLDCESKHVVFKVGDDLEVVMVGERQYYLSNEIFALVAEKLIRKGCNCIFGLHV